MSRFIFIQYDNYDEQYLESTNYLNSMFHDQPTRINRNVGEVQGLDYQPGEQPTMSGNFVNDGHGHWVDPATGNIVGNVIY